MLILRPYDRYAFSIARQAIQRERERERESVSRRLMELHGFVFTTLYPIFSELKSFLEGTRAL